MKRDQSKLRDLVKEAEAAGLVVSTTSKGHLRMRGHGILLFSSGTPSDTRAWNNAQAQMRRALAAQKK